MLPRFAVFGLLAVACCSGPPSHSMAEAPFALAGATVVPLAADDRPVAEVRLDGSPPRRFMIDTGAEISLVSSACARELQLSVRPYAGSFRTIGSTGDERELRDFAAVDRLVLGELVVRSCRITVVDDEAVTNAAIDGILGQDLLSRLTIALDMRERALHLVPSTGKEAVRAYLEATRIGVGAWASAPFDVESTPVLRLPVEGQEQPLPLWIDTGAQGTTLPREAILALHATPVGTQTSEGIGGSRELAKHRIEGFDLFGLKFGLEVTESRTGKGLLGMDVLSQLVVVLDGPARTLWLHHRGR